MGKCAKCGWHYAAHGSKNQCPKSRPNPDGSKPRFAATTPTGENNHG